MITIFKATTPAVANGLPVLTQWPVILSASEVVATAKQIEVHLQGLLVQATKQQDY